MTDHGNNHQRRRASEAVAEDARSRQPLASLAAVTGRVCKEKLTAPMQWLVGGIFVLAWPSFFLVAANPPPKILGNGLDRSGVQEHGQRRPAKHIGLGGPRLGAVRPGAISAPGHNGKCLPRQLLHAYE